MMIKYKRGVYIIKSNCFKPITQAIHFGTFEEKKKERDIRNTRYELACKLCNYIMCWETIGTERERERDKSGTFEKRERTQNM